MPTTHYSHARRLYNKLRDKWTAADLAKKVTFANDSMSIQLAEMFQHCVDIDAGDVPIPATPPIMEGADRSISAAFQPSIGPSSHTNPAPTLAFQMKELYKDEVVSAAARTKDALTARHGFSLWIGPSQAPTSEDGVTAGVYLKGQCPPGSVVGLVPGAVFNGEMMRKPRDAGHLANPASSFRRLIPRLDEALIDVYGAREHAASNPYALGHLVRHPPPGVVPNVMRLQVDFIADTAAGGDGLMPFPPHLRDYIPNSWGSDVGMGQQLYGALEQGIWAKGMALIALRPLWNEELFVDWSLNPYSQKQLPAWYTPLDEGAARRIWKGIGE